MMKRSLVVVVALGLLTSASWATVVPIDANSCYAGDPNAGPFNLESVSVGGVVYNVGDLLTGKTNHVAPDPNDPNLTIATPCPENDDLDINTQLNWQLGQEAYEIVFDEVWSNTNADANDFIFFEIGGNSGDDPTLAAIFPDGSLGAELHIQPGVNLIPGWGAAAFSDDPNDSYNRIAADANDPITERGPGSDSDGQQIAAFAFAITDLLDVNGVALTNDDVIKGIKILNRGGTDPAGFFAVAPPAELAHQWTLDEEDTAEGAVVADAVGDVNGVVVGTGITSVEGVIGSAFAFDGESHVSLADMDTTELKMLSVALWINPDVNTVATGGYKRVFSGGDNFEIILQPDTGQVGNNFYRKGGEYPLSDPLVEGEWTHVAVTSTLISAGGSGNMTVYLNGALNVAMDGMAIDDWGGGEMRIAHRPNSNPHFQGMLDDVRIYKGVLTMGQLEAAINGD